MAADDDYRPHSVNAMFSRIEEHLETQDDSAREYREEIKGLLNGLVGEFRELTKRVASLEEWRLTTAAEKKGQARVALALASGVSSLIAVAAWIFEHFRKK